MTHRPQIIRTGDSPPPYVPRILFAGQWDWANLCNRLARGINALAGEVRARVWTENRHPYGYQEDLIGAYGEREASAHAFGSDWLITSGDGGGWPFAVLPERSPLGPRIAVTHAGSAYRQNAERYNRSDLDSGALVRFVGADSVYLATSGPPTFPYWSTSDTITVPAEPPDHGSGVRICHSTSNRSTKGTDAIVATLLEVQRDLSADGITVELDIIERAPVAECIERRGRCQIFVDQLCPEIGGFGASAIEAMASGCTVLADINHTPEWDGWHAAGVEEPPIIHVSDAEALRSELIHLVGSPETLIECRAMALEWVRQWATPTAMARYFVGRLNEAAKLNGPSDRR